MFNTPILFLIFNRPDNTSLVFEEISKIKPRYLFVAADGPRVDKLGEFELCYKTRSIINNIDWDCEIKTLYRDVNLGCGKAVSEAITWFFDHVEQGIILEDDCLPDLSFFSYCENLLNYYKDEKSILHIGGNNSQLGRKTNEYSYYFSMYPHIWGWATWRRAWKLFKFNLKDEDIENNINLITKHYKLSVEEGQYWKNHLNLVKNGKIDTWDIQWTYSCWLNKGMTIVPNTNLISNIGFHSEATHTTSSESILANLPLGKINEIKHPVKLVIDKKADRYTFRKYNLAEQALNTRIRNWISKMTPLFLKTGIKKIIK
jgi:hypothetical protein